MRKRMSRAKVALFRKGIQQLVGFAKRRRRGFRFKFPRYGKAGKANRQPGFDAFTIREKAKDKSGNNIEKIHVIAPETGIHSLAWSLAILPQPGTFLALPYEIRQNIYRYCILFRSLSQPIIQPRKNGKKFVSKANPIVLPVYEALSLISRQTYVDVVGGGIVYNISQFSFNSPTLMTNYLGCINPAHKNRISTLVLHIRITKHQTNIPKKVFVTLASIRALQYLDIVLSVDIGVCEPKGMNSNSSRNYVLPQKLVTRIEENKNWTMIKGLRTFNLRFVGWHCPHVGHPPSGNFEPREEAFMAAQEVIRRKVLGHGHLFY